MYLGAVAGISGCWAVRAYTAGRSTSAWFSVERSSYSCITSTWSTTTGRIGDASSGPYGNGLALWFEIDDFDEAVRRAEALRAQVVRPPHRNPPDGPAGRHIASSGWEEVLHDDANHQPPRATPPNARSRLALFVEVPDATFDGCCQQLLSARASPSLSRAVAPPSGGTFRTLAFISLARRETLSSRDRDSILGRYSLDDQGHRTTTAYGRLAVVGPGRHLRPRRR
jgi:hypothetical protein